MATYQECGAEWLRQVEGWKAPAEGETAIYWPDIDCTDFLRTASIAQQHRAALFADYRNANNEIFTPEVTEAM